MSPPRWPADARRGRPGRKARLVRRTRRDDQAMWTDRPLRSDSHVGSDSSPFPGVSVTAVRVPASAPGSPRIRSRPPGCTSPANVPRRRAGAKSCAERARGWATFGRRRRRRMEKPTWAPPRKAARSTRGRRRGRGTGDARGTKHQVQGTKPASGRCSAAGPRAAAPPAAPAATPGPAPSRSARAPRSSAPQ